MCIKIECCYFIPFTRNKFSSSYVRPIRFYFRLLRSRWKVGQIAKSEAFPDTWNGGNLSSGIGEDFHQGSRVVLPCQLNRRIFEKSQKSLWNCDANLILKSYPLDQKDILFALGMNSNNATFKKKWEEEFRSRSSSAIFASSIALNFFFFRRLCLNMVAHNLIETFHYLDSFLYILF